jgi:serine/threonine protein kinase
MAEHQLDPGFEARLGRALGPGFEIIGLLGRGGFADVYEIRDCQLDRRLAVKVLRPEIAWGPWMISRFEREARALANLNHLNIPPVHFVGDNEGLVYYVMPVIEGPSLGDLLVERGPIAPAFLVDAFIPVLEALEHAHSLGIVHRDIKPDNIIIEKRTGRPLLVDFGVAKQLETGAAGTSLPGIILGTPGYISPEQALAEQNIDARSDVYAVGATMFHLLTGSTTFPGDTAREIIGHQMNGEVPVPHHLNQAIPEWLSGVVTCALSSRREDRFQSAAAMAEALRAGRRSGVEPEAPVGIGHIRQDDPTPKMVRVATQGTHSSTQREQTSEVALPDPRTGTHHSYFSWTLLLGLAGGTAAYFSLVPSRFVLRNDLLLPVEVSTDPGILRTVAPGAELALPLTDDGRMVARWFVVQPRPDSGRPQLGEAISGVIRVNGLNALELLMRRARRSINTWADGSVMFAPLVHNQTAGTIRVTINRMSGGSNCNCSVPPGETRLLGYYRLDANSFVRVENGRREAQSFRNLESRIDLNTGVLDLRVDSTILSRSPE